MHYLPRPGPDHVNSLTAEDCPNCGRPTLVGIRYEGVFDERIVLDALPLRTWIKMDQAPYGHCVMEERDVDRYSEHVCPLDQEPNR